ncbi:amidohydrolase family protein [Komagataeibacter xylinus]|uniref:amidohydrolase family protein n=1 Tax=Komagataeibacter xylinus TaxID=28448 RepID=UPI001A91BDB7|nr:amidohydrolase family protein [Komagataeibacter xylinus]
MVGGMVFDGTGAVPRRVTVVIDNDRITAVGRDVAVPADARVIDVHGMAVTPGLYDLHTHWGLEGTPADVPSIAHAYLVSGVTTVNDFNEETEAFAPLRAWLAQMPAPHVNFAARISTPGGHGADWSDQDTTRWASTAASGKAAIDSVVAYHPDLIKIFSDGWRYGRMPDDTSMNEQTLAAAVVEAHADHLKVMTHTVTVERGLLAARAKVDSLAHSMQDRVLTSAEIATIRASGMGDVATLAVYDPDKWRRVPGHKAAPNTRLFDNALKNVRKLYRAGVPIGVGTDAGMPATPHGESTLHELELLVRAGLTPAQALLAATRISATLEGQQADRGTIAPGMRADITVFNGRPWKHIADIHHVAMTMVDGRPLFGLGAPAQASGTGWPTAVPAARLIDDFERADGRSSLNTLRRDTMDWGQDRTEEVSGTMPSETGKGKILFIAARMADKKDAYAGVAVPLSPGSVLPVDVTAYKGVTLAIRGAPCPTRLTVTGTVGATWSTPVNITRGWQTINVPFTALHVVDPKTGRLWTGRDVTEVEIGQGCPAEHKSWLQADNLAFYTRGGNR